MKKVLILLVCVSSIWFGKLYGHGLNLSTIELAEEKGQYTLSFNLSRLDLMTSMLTAFPESGINDDNVVAYLEQYIHSNFGLTMNGECQEFVVKQIEVEKAFIKVVTTIPFKGYVEIIEVFNSCLVDYNLDHQNIFKANVNGRLRSFRMTANRKTTQVNYQS